MFQYLVDTGKSRLPATNVTVTVPAIGFWPSLPSGAKAAALNIKVSVAKALLYALGPTYVAFTLLTEALGTLLSVVNSKV